MGNLNFYFARLEEGVPMKEKHRGPTAEKESKNGKGWKKDGISQRAKQVERERLMNSGAGLMPKGIKKKKRS